MDTYIRIIHYSFHWSFAIVDNIKKRISTDDSGVQISGSHSKPNEALKASLESISGKQWDMEQVQVPQQDEGESYRYRMLSNLNKVIKGPVKR
jgi:Ulp1 family protease